MNQFIGFSDSDKFLAAIDPSKPINLNISRKHGRPDKRFGIAVDSTVLTLSQVQGNEALYFAHATHRYQVMNGEVFGLDKDAPKHMADQVQKAVEEYLRRHNITWREALLAMPVNLVTLDGEPTFLKYDIHNHSYSYREPEDVRPD